MVIQKGISNLSKQSLIASLGLVAQLVVLVNTLNDDINLMPYPRQLITRKAPGMTIDRNFVAEIKEVSSNVLTYAVERLYTRIEAQTGLFLLKSFADDDISSKFLIIVKNEIAENVQQFVEDESYSLHVSMNKSILNANTIYGALRGIETFLQLIKNGPNCYEVPAVDIVDEPRFPWRGFMLDSARHFIPTRDIKRLLDGMASAKLNTFHWHLTDDQGWRFESKLYPKLHEIGGNGKYYTQKEIRSIVLYAHNLGIRVIPEIDLPGHASSIAVAYPELMSEVKEYKFEHKWGVHEPLLDPTNQMVYTFIDDLIGEISTVFEDEYIHIGGDEVNPKQWNKNARINQFMEDINISDSYELQAYFNQAVWNIINKHGKKMIGWDEIYNKNLPKDIVIQSWRGHDSLAKAAKDGYKSILSLGYYIDQAQPASMHYRNDPIPTPLQVDDEVHAGELWQTWSFEAPRKRGSAVKGSFTIIWNFTNNSKRGFIDFKGRSRSAIHNIEEIKGITMFWVDSWMGKTMPRVNLKHGNLTGNLVVGNSQYVMTGKLIAGSNIKGSIYPSNLHSSQLCSNNKSYESNIIGGEIALWGELIKPDILDIRVWPRSFAIAERLWSPSTLTDEDSMYRRMKCVGDWSIQSTGLQHDWYQIKGLMSLANGYDVTPLRIFSEAIEPAQYYHRHHEKSANENYDQFDPLNRLADVLPPENLKIRELNKLVDSFLSSQNQTDAAERLKRIFRTWIENENQLQEVIDGSCRLFNVKTVAKRVEEVSRLAIKLIESIKNGKLLSMDEVESAKITLSNAQKIQDELVVSSAYPVEKLLYHAF